jgi:hypothetical protein
MKKVWLLILLACLGYLGLAPLHAEADSAVDEPSDAILIDSLEVQVTSTELMLYLELLAIEAGLKVEELTSLRVAQAIIEVYALKTVMADAAGTRLYSSGLEAWLPEHLFTMHKVSRFINVSVDEAMTQTDWAAEAREYYAANIENFMVPESVTVRTLLLRTVERSVDEALEIANVLLSDYAVGESFESLVTQHSEDEVGRAAGGLMENVSRGQTVLPFEEAAFSLAVSGELSPPVVSEFGVHLIQLLSKAPARTQPFDEVANDIVEYLKPIRKVEYREAIKSEARQREPAGYQINEPAIDAFMTSLGHDKLPNLGSLTTD